MPDLVGMVDDIRIAVEADFRNTVADCIDIVADTQYIKEPEALYSGVEVGLSLKQYAQAIRDGNQKTTGSRSM